MYAWVRVSRGAFPSWADLRAADLGAGREADWDWAFLVDLEKSGAFLHFSYLGEEIAKLSKVYLAGAGDWAMTMLERAARDISAAVAEEAPHLSEDTLFLNDGRTVLFRSMTAPLADDGVAVSHVLGVVSGRIADAGAPYLRPPSG